MTFDLRRILYVTNHLLMIPHLNSIIIDGIPLDNDNGAFRRGLQLILGEQKNVYVTGNAGTGKTVFLKALRHISKKRIVVAAPTGRSRGKCRGHDLALVVPPQVSADASYGIICSVPSQLMMTRRA